MGLQGGEKTVVADCVNVSRNLRRQIPKKTMKYPPPEYVGSSRKRGEGEKAQRAPERTILKKVRNCRGRSHKDSSNKDVSSKAHTEAWRVRRSERVKFL